MSARSRHAQLAEQVDGMRHHRQLAQISIVCCLAVLVIMFLASLVP